MPAMANWQPLRDVLRDVADSRTFTWQELDALVGGLPPSATRHQAFWSGERSGWPGFRTTAVRPGRSVTFVRREDAQPVALHRSRRNPPPAHTSTHPNAQPDIVLVTCVKSKLNHAAPAKDLYTSPLFRKQRRYAEATGVPWFILSAKCGLVAPDEVIEPYELYLATTSTSYRRDWGTNAVRRLVSTVGPLKGHVIEVHASAAYAAAIRRGLLAAGAELVEPLAGLTLGQRLAWYNDTHVTPEVHQRTPGTSLLVEALLNQEEATRPDAFLAKGDTGLKSPGLYSWWVDVAGARDLAAGLGHPMAPGLIYAGLAGATRSRSGKRSLNTLWGRIRGMHLGGNHEFSTFRRTLGAVLASQHGESSIDEHRLTAWMHEHLRVVAVPVADADALDQLETDILAALDPPLNLAKMPRTDIRVRLTGLRQPFPSRRTQD